MIILLTNDDGIKAPGLLALKGHLQHLGEVFVVAPDRDWADRGHAKTLGKAMPVKKVMLPDGSPAYATTGSPSDCVAIGMMGLLRERPGLVVAGINLGANLGYDITYSGTAAAAMESVIRGVPAIAVSLALHHPTESPTDVRTPDYTLTAKFTADLARRVLQRGLPPDLFLNVNVPNLPKHEIQGVEFTRVGRRAYRDSLDKKAGPQGLDAYEIRTFPMSERVGEGTDIFALDHDYISVTPIQLDMTEYRMVKRMVDWGLDTTLQ